jgi:hypothetical protein
MHNKRQLTLIFILLMSLNQTLWAEQDDGGIEESESDLVMPVTQGEPSMQSDSDMGGEKVEAAAPSAGGVESAETVETTDAAKATETVEPPEAVEPPEVAEPTEAQESSEAQVPVESSQKADTKMPSAPSDISGSMRDHWKAREERYQSLRERAEEAGVMLPERPPWYPETGQMVHPGQEEWMAHRKEMMSMSDEEREAYRQQRHEQMRAWAEEMGMEMPEMPPWMARQQAMDEEWAKHQQVIQGMSEEERAACHAMHRRHMGMMHRGRGGYGCGGMGHQGCGMRQDEYTPRMMPGYGAGPGYGYGHGAAPYGPGPQNFWDPNQ